MATLNVPCSLRLLVLYTMTPLCTTGCPSGSIGASLKIIASWDDEFSNLDLHVVEPGGVEVSDQNKLGVSKTSLAFHHYD